MFEAGEKDFTCCNKDITRDSILSTDMPTNHDNLDAKPPFLCNFCHKSFKARRDLMRHESTHTGEKPFACSFCEKNFSRKDQLRMHEKNHTEGRNFACSFCEKKFTTNNNLVLHERLHTGKGYSFKCSNPLYK